MMPFEIGLVMAGAISAGAYTAGVIDFLFEALDEWEKEKSRWRDAAPGTVLTGTQPPMHEISIKAITGASAGGMTAALIASVASRNLVSTKTKGANPGSSNPLYDAWVKQVDIKGLLSTSDLTNQSQPRSLLNATALDEIAKTVFKGGSPLPQRRSYLARDLNIFFSLSNTNGIPYSIDMRGESKYGHAMKLHRDFTRYVLDPVDENQVPSDAKIVRSDQLGEGNWNSLISSALATGAFPIGLAPRKVERQASDFPGRIRKIAQNDLDKPGANPTDPIDPAWDLHSNDKYEFTYVDGGMIDNEPLELCRRALAGEGANPREGKSAHRAVIMVDPFPDDFTMSRDRIPIVDQGLMSMAGAVISALKNQARFKLEELQLALSESVYSRYLIAPSIGSEVFQKLPPRNNRNKPAIACGGLGGFGGFFSRDFREFDYQLGRRNCQRFLQYHFAVPENNVIIQQEWGNNVDREAWYLIRPGWDPITGGDKYERDNLTGEKLLPLIPLMPRLNPMINSTAEVECFDWTQLRMNELKSKLTKPIKERLEKVVKGLIGGPNSKLNGALQWAVVAAVKGAISERVFDAIVSGLDNNWQIEDPPKFETEKEPQFENVH